MNTATPLSISDRVVDEARSIHQHEDPLAPSRGFFFGFLFGAVCWSCFLAVVAWWLS